MPAWIFYLLAGMIALYALHRLCLHLEARGYVYYWHKKRPPSPGGGNVFLPFQEFVQPQIRHVIEAEEHRPLKIGDEGNSGAPPGNTGVPPA
jgi:hypothetical protein